MKKIVLASASPRRQELLKDIVGDFSVIPSNADETVPENMSVNDIPQYLSLLKARDIAKTQKDAVVIGSDTIVVIDDKVLGKPRDEQDAYTMLKLLSGRKHKVMTGCALVCNDREVSFTETTEVEFFELSDKEIESYIRSKDPFDKAGAYGIQSQGKTLVKSIYGDYYSVVGLPVGRLKRELESFKSFIKSCE